MASCNSQKRDGRPFRLSTPLLPVSKGMDADPDGTGELLLRKADKRPQRGNVLPGLETSLDESVPKSAGNGARELLVGQLGNFFAHIH